VIDCPHSQRRNLQLPSSRLARRQPSQRRTGAPGRAGLRPGRRHHHPHPHQVSGRRRIHHGTDQPHPCARV